ncbi:SNF2-related protein [Neofusicoccum parvum]|uniref:SNF2-related protein n=1 Tax=Neofusicoccum parvum TaxID=310453 RepID=A0ACB5S5A3_9PEZI|nr:SNF2-related protein [Neofusicoccum parvum]
MDSAKLRLQNLAAHFFPSSATSSVKGSTSGDASNTNNKDAQEYSHRYNFHTLSPTSFLPRAAAIEPNAEAIYHVTANGRILRRTYEEAADRARGLAYFLKKHAYKRVGILAPNTPAFLESFFGIAAAGAVSIAVNYRLKSEDISYIFQHSEAEIIIVDAEFVNLLDDYRAARPSVPILVDTDTDATEGELSGPFDEAVLEGLHYDTQHGSKGWSALETQAANEDDVIALAYTSWTFPWAVTAVRGTHYCLRKIDYPEIWRLLKEEQITHFNAAPTVNTLLCAAEEAESLARPVRVTVAASPPTAHLFETMTKLNLYPVHVYGMTETYGPITKGYHMPEWEELPLKEKYARMARQGHGFVMSLPIRVIKPEEPEGVLIDVEKNGTEIGEIVFTGNICAKGYFKDPEATRKLFAGGVLHSGDLAVWHPDGALHILDRAKDIIISGGENISSVALESMLVTHPDVLEAGVVAVPDSHWGERPKAFITVKQGKALKGEDLIAWAKNHSAISKFMVPREVEVVGELPKTSTGKVKKNVLRDWAKGADRTTVS